MNSGRPNFTWPVLIIGVGVVTLLIYADALPDAYGDLLVRSWPVLLIMFGLNVLLAGRVRFANWGILLASVAVVVVIANFAYAERSQEYREDYRESWQDVLPDTVEQLTINIETTDTLVALTNAPEPRQAQVEFVGSTESELDVQLEVTGTAATFNITETRSGILPRLAEVGRGRINIFLPWGVFIQELNFTNDDGPVTLDLTNLEIRWVDAQLSRGNMKLCLPQRVANEDFVMIGNQVQLGNGELRMVVPDGVTLSLATNSESQPTYIPAARASNYVFLFEGGLETRGVVNNQFDVLLDLNVDGDVILDHERQCQ
jgi:hypothetical protein